MVPARPARAFAPALPSALPRTIGIGLAILTLSLSAHARVPLPWTPVPVTLQDVVVLLAGALLGLRAGVAATLGYLALGAAGAPVFASGAGLAYLAGPTGGYLVGFVAAAALVGALRPIGRPFASVLGILAAGELLIHVLGVLGLSLVTGMGLASAAAQGSLTFLPVTVPKIGFAATLVFAYGRLLARALQNDDAD
jgi:biotin transport system substrate-specific component